MAQRSTFAVFCFCAVFLCVLTYTRADFDYDRYKDTGTGEVRHEMDALADSVKDAMQNAQRARDHKDVLDLGQSLHILEHKFAGLKQAIAHELGTKMPTAASHSEESKRMVESTSRLLDDVAAYRQDMQKLMVSVREIDASIRTMKDGLASFDQEVDEMNRMLADLHVKTNELHENHYSSNHQIEETTKHMEQHHANTAVTSGHRWYYIFLLVQIAALGYYVYLNRSGLSRSSAKYLNKYG